MFAGLRKKLILFNKQINPEMSSFQPIDPYVYANEPPQLLLSVDGACPSLVTSVVQMPTKTIPELSKPAFGVLPKTGDAEPEDPGKPG